MLEHQHSTEGFEPHGGFLSAPAHAGDLVAWIILRPQKKGRPLVTTQQLFGQNPILDRYSTQEQLQRAVESYL